MARLGAVVYVAAYHSPLAEVVVYSSPSHLGPRSMDLAPGLVMDLESIHMVNRALLSVDASRHLMINC